MSKQVRFYFDYISPYAYIGWHRVCALAARRMDVALEPTPILFAGLLNHHGHVGPAEVPAKRVYVFQDCLRLASLFDLPLEPPPAHPFNPLLALRVTALDMPADVRAELITRFYAATWGGGGGVTDPDHVAEIARDVGVNDPVERASDPEVKARVKSSTIEAIGAGVFGVPSIVVDQQMFWGVDSLQHVERYLDGDDPVTGANIERWADLPVGASRRRD